MKLAVCISGICRGNVQRNVARFRTHFPQADFFFSTWEGRQVEFSSTILHPEPEMHYHPYVDIEEDLPSRKWVSIKYKACKEQARYERHLHHSKQILAHAHLLDEIDSSYDMIIRTRYDTYSSDQVDFMPWVNRSYKERCAIGFGTRAHRHPNLHTFAEVPKIKWYEETTRESKVSLDWGWCLLDQLIIHPRDMFDTKLAFELYENKQLLGGEWGWYQMLSKPYKENHISVYGGVQHQEYL